MVKYVGWDAAPFIWDYFLKKFSVFFPFWTLALPSEKNSELECCSRLQGFGLEVCVSIFRTSRGRNGQFFFCSHFCSQCSHFCSQCSQFCSPWANYLIVDGPSLAASLCLFLLHRGLFLEEQNWPLNLVLERPPFESGVFAIVKVDYCCPF